jgi:protein TonB
LSEARPAVASAALWAGLVALSVAAHLGVLGLAGRAGERRAPAPRPRQSLRVTVVDRPPPPPPPVPVTPPRRVRQAVAVTPPPPRSREPPPAPAAAQAPPAPSPPVLIPGLALSSTSEAGAFAVPVGNTLAGPPGASRPDAPAPPAGAEVVPGHALGEAPVFLDNVPPAEVRRHYPEDARKARLEGAVTALLTIAADGRVVGVVVIVDPGHGFAEAAARLARRYRFRPARVEGRAVATEISFTIRFELD